MERIMGLRIFDHLFVDHGWHGSNCVASPEARVSTGQESAAVEISATERAEIERRSIIARLTYRCGSDPIMRRAARRLQGDSRLSIRQLAAELGVGEEYLSKGLRAALGENFDSTKLCPSASPRPS
jgi:hypothetical protein